MKQNIDEKKIKDQSARETGATRLGPDQDQLLVRSLAPDVRVLVLNVHLLHPSKRITARASRLARCLVSTRSSGRHRKRRGNRLNALERRHLMD